MSFLRVSGISKQKDQAFILQNIHFNQAKFQQIAIAGETGSGKSTLLKIIAGIIQPDAGTVLFEDVRVKGPLEQLLPGHPSIAYLSQHFELRNNYRVEEVLEMATKLPAHDAATIFTICQINHLLKRRTDQLSGGEKQRIAIARLLINTPKLLLLDEPFSNLDMVHKNTMKQVINAISRQLQITCMMVSHEPADTLVWADEIIVMKDGRIVQQGAPSLIYNQPADEYTAGLFGRYNILTLGQVQAFSRLPGMQLRWDNIMIRPEHLLLTNDSDGIRGTVDAVHFHGRYTELEVSIGGHPLVVQTNDTSVHRGDVVYLAVQPNHVWYM
ncbi:ABC transporter ATP-binding protein [Aridibaculum aurantiacum]|uniref:ABC transporter ATP-binding protein n=1 Tax=Aridibaculum aurantiacum TaxID=2810307 RepID=UPI001A96325F|nr:ABC transporter ATP-binding protein [Aridibaculum aurantiacum]